jgi:hypothetical protein
MISRWGVIEDACPEGKTVGGVAPRGIGDWILLIRGEYLGIPHLRLTRVQMQRFWGFDEKTCEEALEALLEARFLKESAASGFVRDDSRQVRLPCSNRPDSDPATAISIGPSRP